MKIGVDIDNTITHTTEMIMHYARIYGEEHGLNTVADPNYYYLEDALGWDRDTAEFFLDTYLGQIYREMRPKDQAVEVMRKLKDEHELFLITSRNQQFPEVEQVTLEWLERYGIAYDGLILNATPNMHFFSKLGVCLEHGVEVMIEDHHDLILELAQAFPVIVFDYPYNRHIQAENVFRVNHWQEVLDHINRLAAERSII
ncbi:MAG: 5' nucleotidase, NT5C type [Deltaproteobacteria bacterium]